MVGGHIFTASSVSAFPQLSRAMLMLSFLDITNGHFQAPKTYMKEFAFAEIELNKVTDMMLFLEHY